MAAFCLTAQAQAKDADQDSASRAEAKACSPKFELDINVKDKEEIEYTLKDKESVDGKKVKQKKIRISDPDGSEVLLAMNLLSEKLTASELKGYRAKAIISLEKFIVHWKKLGHKNKDVAQALERAKKLLAQLRDGKFDQALLQRIVKEVIKPVDVAVAEMKREGKKEEIAEFQGSQKPIFKPIPQSEDVATEDEKPINNLKLYEGVKNTALNRQISRCNIFDVQKDVEEVENTEGEKQSHEQATAVTQNNVSSESSAGIE